jgi:hypothetical protein
LNLLLDNAKREDLGSNDILVCACGGLGGEANVMEITFKFHIVLILVNEVIQYVESVMFTIVGMQYYSLDLLILALLHLLIAAIVVARWWLHIILANKSNIQL